jgi:hypothetical protein
VIIYHHAALDGNKLVQLRGLFTILSLIVGALLHLKHISEHSLWFKDLEYSRSDPTLLINTCTHVSTNSVSNEYSSRSQFKIDERRKYFSVAKIGTTVSMGKTLL